MIYTRNILLEDSITNFSKYLGYKIIESDFSEALSVFKSYYMCRPLIYPGDHEMYNIMSNYAATGANAHDCKLIILKQFK